ncbi:hypothetical protein BD626DRAFT_633889 [Schizophyllum amplum]|uniref:F-box domain-containing protein n=1 Tax=Schizophyllum amplum TaxID=97359 RepID=A0A550C1E7_9AGAR|nr:hypothetical protein BD626DRAFT_633889 [Auriculariopsis ampla]
MLPEHFALLQQETSLCSKCGTSVSAATPLVPLDLIRGQALPTAQDSVDIRQGILSDEATVQSYARVIGETKRTLEQLQQQHDLLVANLDRKRALLAPIRRLPREIITMIVKFAIARTLRRKADSSLGRLHVVLRVSHLWRWLAFETPQLWADIVLYPQADPHWHFTLSECLQHSKAQPVDIHLRNKEDAPWRLTESRTYSEDEWLSVIEPLLASAPRWKALRLDVSCYMVFSLLPQQSSRLALLETLQLTSVENPNKITFFKDTPALSSVHITDLCGSDRIELPWSQLSELDIGVQASYASLRDCVNMISHCHQLSRLSLFSMTEDMTDYTPITLPVLQYLKVGGMANCLLQSLVAPDLQELHALSSYPNSMEIFGEEAYYALLGFADVNPHTVGAKLTTLSLMTTALQENEWVELFEKYTNVSHLAVCDFLVDTPAHNLARALISNAALLPDLVRLDFPTLCVAPSSMKTMIDLVEHRVVHRPLGMRKLEEISVMEVDDSLHTCFRELRDKGLKLYAAFPEDMCRSEAEGGSGWIVTREGEHDWTSTSEGDDDSDGQEEGEPFTEDEEVGP